MTNKLWPNGLGCDIDDAEVWFHSDKFRVFTTDRVLLVPHSITSNPETAVAITREQGLLQAELDDMQPWEAQALFLSYVPTQKELF